MKKTFRILNIVLSIASILATIGAIIYYVVVGDPNKRILVSCGIVVMFILPYILERIFKTKFGNLTLLIYTLFVVLSGFVGATLNVTYKISWFNKVCHVLFGYLGCLLGLMLLVKTDSHKNLKPFMILLICVMASISLHALWEVWEFSSDNIFGTTAQGFKVNGIAPYVTDTMTDILANLTGALVFAIQYFVFYKFKKGKFIPAIVKDFEKQKDIAPLNDNLQ